MVTHARIVHVTFMTSIWRTETIFNLEKMTDMGLGFPVFAEDKAVVSADKTSVVSADKTSVVSADKTSVVSADKTSVVSQDIPIPLATQPRCGCLLNMIGMSWETADVLSADTTDVLPADTMSCLQTQQMSCLQTQQMSCLQTQQAAGAARDVFLGGAS